MSRPRDPEAFVRCRRCGWVHTVWTADPGDTVDGTACLRCGTAAEWLPSDGADVPDGGTMPVLIWPPDRP